MADDPDSQFAQFMVFAVGQCLRRSDHDTFAGMDAQRVEVLHIADRDAIVETVAHHFIFHFFPPFQALFHQYLGREREGFFDQHIQFLFVVAEAGTEATQCISGTDNHRIT